MVQARLHTRNYLSIHPPSLFQVVRRPDGKRPPLTNIAELTAGLLSHVDLDATDITAALFLASAAQNRRRRLRIAKALLPVYKAIRSGAAGSGTSSEELLSSGEEGGWVGRPGRSTVCDLEDPLAKAVCLPQGSSHVAGRSVLQSGRRHLAGAFPSKAPPTAAPQCCPSLPWHRGRRRRLKHRICE